MSDEVKSITSGGTLPFPTTHERFMIELESSEGQLGAIIRSLYDDQEQDEFLTSLSSRIKQHEKDIERMCNKNYQGFIESVTHLVKVKSEAHKLKNKVQDANRVIQDSGKELYTHLKDLHNARTIQRNITASVETLTLCIPVLEMYDKLQNLMKEKQFYSALKTLEQLEHIHLPRVRGYIFSELLAEEIPRMRESIQAQSMSELKEYLAKVRAVSGDIGEVAMQQEQKSAKLDLSSDVRKLLQSDQSVNVETACAQDIVDFSPVYRCLHIHFVLGRRDQFIEEYRNQRRQQLRLAIKPPSKVDDIQEYKRYFFQIIGFFVVEDTILHTCQGQKDDVEGLMSESVLDEFWQMATSEMLSVLRHHCLHCQNNHLLLKIKQLIVWFCHTVMGYGFSSDKLYEVTLEIREHYDEILMKTYGDAFQNLLKSDDYTPVVVETDQQFSGVLDMFPYKDLQIQKDPFPKKFPFSSMVIQIFKQIKSYIDACWDYSDRLNLSRTEIDEAIRRSVNLLLTKSMSGCLASLIHNSNLTIRQLAQLWVNIDQWEHAEDDLDMYIAFVTSVPRSDTAGVQSRLYGFSIFKDAKLSTEGQISMKLEEQISEVMEGLAYDWVPKEVMKQHSSVLNDVISFMNTTFELLTVTPTAVIDNVCIHILQHMVGLMEQILLSDKVPRVNMEGLRSFGVDVKYLEDFVRKGASKMVPQLREEGGGGGMTDAIFARLNQLLSMFYDSAWTDYIGELTSVGVKKYPSVSPDAVHNLLQKLRAQEKKKKTRAAKVTNKFKSKKEPNPVKVALKAIEEHLQERNTTDFIVGSRLAMSDRAPSMSRGSPVLFNRLSTTNRSTASTKSTHSSEDTGSIKDH